MRKSIPVLIVLSIIFFITTHGMAQKTAENSRTTESKIEEPVSGTKESPEKKSDVKTEKNYLDGEECYFDLTYLNLFNYGLGFVFGIEPVSYGFSGIVGYRHLNSFTGFPGVEGGACVALDLFLETGANIASIDGSSVLSGFLSLTVAPNIFWFKSLEEGNFDRSGNGIFVGAKVEASYSQRGFNLGYGPAIGWSTMYYNTGKSKFRTTNVVLFFYPPTMVLGISATTNF